MGGPGGFRVDPASLDKSANDLLEIAGLLQAGRPEPDMTSRVVAPNSQEEVAAAATDFANFAQNQFQDAVALVAALSTKLKATAASHVAMDAGAQANLDSFLSGSTLRRGI